MSLLFDPISTCYSTLSSSLLKRHAFFVCLCHNLNTLGLLTESYSTNFVKISFIGLRLLKYLCGLCESEIQDLLLKKLLSLVTFLQNSVYNTSGTNAGQILQW